MYDKIPLQKILQSQKKSLEGKWSWSPAFTYARVIHYYGIWPPSKFWEASEEDRAWAVSHYETEMDIQAWDSHVAKMKQEADMASLKNKD